MAAKPLLRTSINSASSPQVKVNSQSLAPVYQITNAAICPSTGLPFSWTYLCIYNLITPFIVSYISSITRAGINSHYLL